METVFVLLVAVLILLAVSDLIVGVSNDAVNFLNSAIGSKSAPFWIIMIIASAGIMVGATFSEGMMEVARKSIFHPDMFGFTEIMIIFLAVMLTDIILLDTFNTLGLPTSTTVSVVFELLGSAVAISILKISSAEGASTGIGDYINSGTALVIISGILLSVIVSFTVGSIVQFIVRIIFSFNYKKSYRNFGALWGGFAIAAITFFMLIKGAKGASFMSDATKDYIKHNTWTIVTYSFIGWTVLLAALQFLAKVNILKIIVLVGTFALAMAFAGNDLVNFIGVPLAGLKSFQTWSGSGVDPSAFSMSVLAEKVSTPTLYLMIAGIIMVITLWLSKKARSVTATELNLSKQDAGYEKYESSSFSRFVVRQSIRLSNAVSFVVPNTVTKAIEKRFTPKVNDEEDNNSAFDLVRASVNLTVASILISFATSFKLPLSTTYVTFMVAMGTSLADGAWGRESAVYRVSGVTTVIGGWFFTAFIAFTAAFLIALLISWTSFYAVPVLLIIAIVILIKSKKAHQEREQDDQKILNFEKEEKEDIDIMERCSNNVINTLTRASESFEKIFNNIEVEDYKKLKKTNKDVDKLNKITKNLKDSVDGVIFELQEDLIETGHYYVQVTDYLREIAHSLTFISKPVFEHFNNQHSGFTKEQNKELLEINKMIQSMFKTILNIINTNNFKNIDEPLKIQQNLIELLKKIRKNQIKRIKQAEVGTKNSILFLNIVSETKNLTLFTINLLKAQRDFIIYQNSGNKPAEVLV